MKPTKIGFSKFCLDNDLQILANAPHFLGEKLLAAVGVAMRDPARVQPGYGRTTLDEVIVVDLGSQFQEYFPSIWVDIRKATMIQGTVGTRVNRPFEDPFINLTCSCTDEALPNKFLRVVLYSKETLLENEGIRTGDYDWEIVAILPSPFEDAPMDPLTMARNFLSKPGGTYAPYSDQKFAESIYFWSGYIRKRSGPLEE